MENQTKATKKKVIESLTPAQIAKLDEYAKMGVQVGYATGAEMDEVEVRRLTDEYRQLVLENDPSANIEPTCKFFKVFDSPEAAIREIPELDPSTAMYGQHDVEWLYTYLYYNMELGLKEETKEIMPLVKLAGMIHWWWLGRNATIITRRPVEIHLLEKDTPDDPELPIKELHNPDGMALKYKDGTGFYALNGILIPSDLEWVITDKARRSDYRQILGIQNTEIRTEVMKLLGAGAIETHLPKKVLDKYSDSVGGDYVLYEVDFNETKRIYLKGACPSSGSEFFEAVHPDVKTCRSALNWRELGEINDVYVPPMIRT